MRTPQQGCRRLPGLAADGMAYDGTEACGMADDMTASDWWQALMLNRRKYPLHYAEGSCCSMTVQDGWPDFLHAYGF